MHRLPHALGAVPLARVARNGFESAFLPHQEREALLAQVDAEIAALTDAGDADRARTGSVTLLGCSRILP